MRRFSILWHIILLPLLAIGQNCGITDTILIGPNRTITYNFDVTDVVNDDLAAPNQGICGIEIEFLHQFSENMELWVISPSGQEVQLMGPNSPDALAFTFGARWDITFVPCAASAVPDSGYVAKWDNNQPRNFVSGGRYTGSYYPYNGCLEDFDTGPVNGQWTIEVRNNPSVYQGAIIGFRLRLCDERGFLCCFADVGSLASYPDVSTCQGDAALDLNIPPVYTGLPPDTAEYAYTYIISQNDVIVGYDSLADLRGFAPGTYTVCGLSYKKTDRDSFPIPNSSASLSQLRSDLNGNLLLYCGKINNNCVEVTITAPGDTTFLNESICQGETFQVGSNTFNTTGEYDITLPASGGCDSLVHLTLTVFAPAVTNLSQTICQGDSVMIGTSVYTASGTYSDVLTTVNGCDSTVNLTLTVLDRIETNISASICQGESYSIGNQNFNTSGTYQIILTSAAGCDSIVNLTLSVLAPQAIITASGNLDCESISVTLDGNNSTPTSGLSFRWLDTNGLEIGNTSAIQVTNPGDYTLLVTQSATGTTCVAGDTVTILQTTQNAPNAVVAPPGTLGCANPQVTLDASGSSQSLGQTYQWSGPGIVSGDDTPTPVVNEPGNYQLLIISANGLCTDTATVQVTKDLNAPVANAGNGDTINCIVSSATLGGNSSTGPSIVYLWQTQGGNIVGPNNTRTIVADAPGTYTLIVTDTSSGCADTSLTTVALDRTPPIADAGDTGLITCAAPDAVLDGSNSSQGANIRYTWTDTSGNLIGNDAIEFATQPGRYFLEVRNVLNGCTARDSVDVSIEQGVPTVTFGDTLIVCDSVFLTLQAFVDPPVGNYDYNWTGSGIQSAPNQPVVQVNTAGEYIFTVRNLDNDCTVTDTVTVARQSCDICVQGAQPDTLTCITDRITLEAILCAPCDNCTIVWTTPDGNFVSGTDGLTPVVDAPGTYTLTLTNSTSFSVSIDFEVFENATPPVADAGTEATISCAQPIAIIGGNNTSDGAEYVQVWRSKSGEPVVPNNSATIAVNRPDTYFLEVLNVMTGCIATDSVEVRIDTVPPVAEAGPSVALNCNTPAAVLDGVGSSAGAGISYNWASASGNIVSGGNTLTPTINAAGLYFLTVSNAQNGCVATDSVLVTSDDLPVIPAIPDTTLTCRNPEIKMAATFPGNGNFQFRWCELDINDNPINCTDGLTTTVSMPGRYRFEVTNTDNACSASRLVNVRDNTIAPTVDAGATDTLDCNQTSWVLNGSATPSNTDYSYQWTARNGSPIENSTTPMPTISQPDIYILTVTNLDNGCAASDSVEMLQNTETPVVFAGFDTTLNCTVTNIRFNPQVIGNNLRYQWITPDGNIASGADAPNAIADAPGAYILQVTNAVSGCIERDTIQVGENIFPPTAAIANAENLSLNCINNIVTLDASISLSQTGAPLTFQWRAAGSGQLIGNLSQPVVQTTTGGTFEIQVTDTRNGCTDLETLNISADFKKPELLIASPEPLTCTRIETTIDATRSSTIGGFTAQWAAPDGSILSDTDLLVTATLSGNYKLVLTNQGNGCSDSVGVLVPINTELPTITIAPPTSLDCEVTATQLIASATGGNGFTYNWVTQNGEIISGQNSATATVGKVGNYTVMVTRADNGCTGEASITVEAIEAAIEQGFYSVIKPNCFERASATVTIDSVRGGTAPYLYSLFDSPFTTENIFENLATGTYDLVIQDRNGCEWQSQVVIPAPDTIQISISEDVEIDFGDSTELTVTLMPPDFQSIVWEPDSTGDTTLLIRVVKPVQTTLYRVTVTGVNGCQAMATVMVFVNETTAVFAPNVFTPDGDGVNDVFMLFAGQTVERINSFMIFDRWGNRIYEAGPFQPNDPNFGWDGTYQGKPMDGAVFVFFAEVQLADGRIETIEGDVTLLR